MKTIDMSEKAIMRRLKQVDQLRDLCLSLMKAKPLSDEDAIRLRQKFREKKSRQTIEIE
jgi:hypothetical protein